MFHIVLYQPEIPPNTGNIIRLSANTGCHLHLIKPLGFELEDRLLRRAGLDYHEWAAVNLYDNYADFLQKNPNIRLFAVSTKGRTHFHENAYQQGDGFIFGPETKGLPLEILDRFPPQQIIRIPMRANSRSLNLSNAAAIIVYEAWRQLGFA